MNSKNIWKYGFNWGSIVGGTYFFGRVIGFYLKIENSFFWGLLVSFVIVFGLGYAMINYRRKVMQNNVVKFSRLFAIGTLMSVFISLFTTLFMLLYITKLNPEYFSDFMSQYMKMMQSSSSSYGVQITDYSMVENIVKIGFIPIGYITDFIGNLFYVLLLSWLMSSSPMVRRNSMPPRNPENDYTPYQDTTISEQNQDTDNQSEENNSDNQTKQNQNKEE